LADLASIGTDDPVTFMVSAGLVFEIIAAFCSSPQTAEINADKRAGTLMKWVYLGLGASAVFVLIAAVPMKGGKPAIFGGALAGAMLGAAYVYAKKSGLRNGGPATESY
jgi:phage tail tape-measure protein